MKKGKCDERTIARVCSRYGQGSRQCERKKKQCQK